MPTTKPRQAYVISALRARANFGKLLDRVGNERHSLIIEKRGAPRAILVGLQDYIRLAAPEPEILRLLGEESEGKGAHKLTSGEINRVISAARAKKSARGPRRKP